MRGSLENQFDRTRSIDAKVGVAAMVRRSPEDAFPLARKMTTDVMRACAEARDDFDMLQELGLSGKPTNAVELRQIHDAMACTALCGQQQEQTKEHGHDKGCRSQRSAKNIRLLIVRQIRGAMVVQPYRIEAEAEVAQQCVEYRLLEHGDSRGMSLKYLGYGVPGANGEVQIKVGDQLCAVRSLIGRRPERADRSRTSRRIGADEDTGSPTVRSLSYWLFQDVAEHFQSWPFGPFNPDTLARDAYEVQAAT